MGVRWVPVPNGVYDRGKSRTNAREAQRIAELVVEHWRNRPEESLGVVTLSQAQMDRVDDVLQERIRKEPDLEGFYMLAALAADAWPPGRRSATSLPGLRSAFQLLQLPEHDLGIVAALLKKLVSLPVELIEDRISVHVGLQEALRACRRTASGSRDVRDVSSP